MEYTTTLIVGRTPSGKYFKFQIPENMTPDDIQYLTSFLVNNMNPAYSMDEPEECNCSQCTEQDEHALQIPGKFRLFVDTQEGTGNAKKIQMIKIVRQYTGLGLKEAKDLVDTVKFQLPESLEMSRAVEFTNQMEDAGALVFGVPDTKITRDLGQLLNLVCKP